MKVIKTIVWTIALSLIAAYIIKDAYSYATMPHIPIIYLFILGQLLMIGIYKLADILDKLHK